MANCAITVSGTSGSVQINYIDAGAVARTITSGLGTFLIADTGTDYTWTTLSGDATAASCGTITLTEIETKCYIVSWEQYPPVGFEEDHKFFKSVVLGSTTYDLTNTPVYPGNPLSLAGEINSMNEPNVKCTGHKIVTASGEDPFKFNLILKVIGEEVPYIKITNPDTALSVYLKGTYTANCLPTGYTEIDTCVIGSILS